MKKTSYSRVAGLCALLPFLAAGCATPAPERYSGPHLTYQHGTARFGTAVEYARGYCGQAGLSAKHVGTDPLGPYQVLSRFECVK